MPARSCGAVRAVAEVTATGGRTKFRPHCGTRPYSKSRKFAAEDRDGRGPATSPCSTAARPSCSHSMRTSCRCPSRKSCRLSLWDFSHRSPSHCRPCSRLQQQSAHAHWPPKVFCRRVFSAVDEAAGVDILCSDKTGTLTRNELAVMSVHPDAGLRRRACF